MNSVLHRNRSLFTITYQDTAEVATGSEDEGTFREVTIAEDVDESCHPAKRVKVATYLNYVKLEPFDGGCVF